MVSMLSSGDKHRIIALQTLADETRFKIFKLLLSGEDLCVTRMAERLGISVSAASQHFRLFELAGLVDKHRYGQRICYVLKTDEPLVKDLTTFVKVG